MYCSKCGEKIDEENNYCTNCGRELEHNTNQDDTEQISKDVSTTKVVLIVFIIFFGIGFLISIIPSSEIEYSETKIYVEDDSEKDTWKIAVLKAKTDNNQYVTTEDGKIDVESTNYTVSGGDTIQVKFPKEYGFDIVARNTEPLSATETATLQFNQNGSGVDSVQIRSIDTLTCSSENRLKCTNDSK